MSRTGGVEQITCRKVSLLFSLTIKEGAKNLMFLLNICMHGFPVVLNKDDIL